MICGLNSSEIDLICEALGPEQLDLASGSLRRALLTVVLDAIAARNLDKKWKVNRNGLTDKLTTLENYHARQVIEAIKRNDRAALESKTSYLMNSAVVSAGAYGLYRYMAATATQLQEFIRRNHPISRVGYPDTCDVIQKLTGYRPIMSRGASVLERGEEAMVVRLRYRIVDPQAKWRQRATEPTDYELAQLVRLE
jgi:hypothetical protein